VKKTPSFGCADVGKPLRAG